MSCCSKSLLKTICFYWTCWQIKRKTYHSNSQALFSKSLKFSWSETSKIYIYYCLILAANGRRRKRKNHVFIYSSLQCLRAAICGTWHILLCNRTKLGTSFLLIFFYERILQIMCSFEAVGCSSHDSVVPEHLQEVTYIYSDWLISSFTQRYVRHVFD